ncbi:MAG: hypothetical protein ABI969_03300 [bacterium]
MRLDGTGVQQVTRSPMQESNADWSPDGKAIAFDNLTTGGGIWIVRRDASGHWGEPVQRQQGGFNPYWSPDGKSIAYLNTQEGGKLLVVPADSGAAQILVDPSVNGLRPETAIWGAGPFLYYEARDGAGKTSIWSIPAAGGASRLLVRFDPVLHPLNRSWLTLQNGILYFLAEDRESDVWVMEVRKP